MSFQEQLNAAKHTMLAALSAAQEDYDRELLDIGAMRCKVQQRTGNDLEALLNTPHAYKEGLAVCEQHGYHVYSTQSFRELVGQRRAAFSNRHEQALLGLGKDAKAQLGSEINQAAASIAQEDVHRYIQRQKALVEERKQKELFEKLTSAGIDLALLEEFYRCYRKRAHPTPQHAQVHVDKLVAAEDEIGGVLGTYQCHYCTGWHVGHVKTGSNVYSTDSALRAVRLLRQRNPAAREFCLEKGLPLSILH